MEFVAEPWRSIDYSTAIQAERWGYQFAEIFCIILQTGEYLLYVYTPSLMGLIPSAYLGGEEVYIK
jgi:hypothetical protein